VGAVERGQQLTGARIAPGDAIVGLASSGAHSNGFALIRRLVEGLDLAAPAPFAPRESLADALLRPTLIYVASLLPLVRAGRVHGLAHITGGGLLENVPRVLPEGLRAMIDARAWAWPPLFGWLGERGGIAPDEMLRTFNCGIGMVAMVAADDADSVIADLAAAGEQAFRIGTVAAGARGITIAGDGWHAAHDA
jgi:phosphoribosylformylglycinamidine cyclo-ligase